MSVPPHRSVTAASARAALLALLLSVACRDGREPVAAHPEPSDPTPPWFEHELGTHAEFRDVLFLDEQRGFIVGGAFGIAGGLLGRTTDGGRTWSFESGITTNASSTSAFHLNAIRFLDEDTAVIVADAGVILRSVDGGAHWHRVHREPGIAQHLLDLDFVDELVGWAVGPGAVLRTVDGGRTWASPLTADPGFRVEGRALEFVGRETGFVVGTAGAVLRTLDGGGTWTRVFQAPGLRLWGVTFRGRDHGWAVGERGRIVATTDGGETWVDRSWTRQAFLRDVRFLDESRGRAVGFNRSRGESVILATDDGGRTWAVELLLDEEALGALFLLDDRHGWAVGERVYARPQRILRYVGEPAGTLRTRARPRARRTPAAS